MLVDHIIDISEPTDDKKTGTVLLQDGVNMRTVYFTNDGYYDGEIVRDKKDNILSIIRFSPQDDKRCENGTLKRTAHVFQGEQKLGESQISEGYCYALGIDQAVMVSQSLSFNKLFIKDGLTSFHNEKAGRPSEYYKDGKLYRTIAYTEGSSVITTYDENKNVSSICTVNDAGIEKLIIPGIEQTKVDETLLYVMTADPQKGWLQKTIVGNLLTNAWEYCFPSGSVSSQGNDNTDPFAVAGRQVAAVKKELKLG